MMVIIIMMIMMIVPRGIWILPCRDYSLPPAGCRFLSLRVAPFQKGDKGLQVRVISSYSTLLCHKVMVIVVVLVLSEFQLRRDKRDKPEIIFLISQ